MKVRVVRKGQRDYPPLLSEAPGGPKELHVAGADLEPAPYLAIVGSRRPTRYGLELTRWLSYELARSGAVIVSGMARGVDAAAHRGALEAGAPTVAVLGSGLDICYPISNLNLYETLQTRGTLISEYVLGTPALPHHFPARNRIIAGMCLGVIITEGVIGGGAMITARLALEANREVFAVAGPVQSPLSQGPHALIREGARLVTSAGEVLEDLGLPVAAETPHLLELAPDESKVFSCLDAEPLLLDVVAKAAGLPIPATAAVLARLELKGVVSRHAAGRFSRSVSVRT